MKKTFLLVSFLIIISCLSGCKVGYEPAPKITEGEFPFILEYEMNGERILIEDTVLCTFRGYDMSNTFAMFVSRIWHASLKSGDESQRLLVEFESDTESVLVKGRKNTESRIVLYYGSGGYYLGDPNDKTNIPRINYVEEYKTSEKETHVRATPLTNEQLEEYFGIKIIRFEFSKPVENTFE